MKRFSAVLCVLLAMLLLLSAMTNALLPAGHDCMHEGCTVCYFLNAVKQILSILILAITAMNLNGHLNGKSMASAGHENCSASLPQTPVDLKVKLSN